MESFKTEKRLQRLFKQWEYQVHQHFQAIPTQLHNAFLLLMGQAGDVLFTFVNSLVERALAVYNQNNSHFISQIGALDGQVQKLKAEHLENVSIYSPKQLHEIDLKMNPFRSKLKKVSSILKQWSIKTKFLESEFLASAKECINLELKPPGKYYIPQINQIVQPQQEMKSVIIYDLFAREPTSYTTDITFPKHYGILQLEHGQAILTGGWNSQHQYLNTSIKVIARPEGGVEVRYFTPMINVRSCHPLVLLGSSRVFATGGYNNNSLAIAQEYDRVKKEWRALPDLLEPRSLHGSCSFSNYYVYIFCGTGKSYLRSIERFTAGQNEWERVKLVGDLKGWKQTWGIGGTQISGKEILLFGSGDGGYRSVHQMKVGEQDITDDGAPTLQVTKYEQNSTSNSPEISCYGRGYGVFGENVYAVDNGYRLWVVKSLKYQLIKT